MKVEKLLKIQNVVYVSFCQYLILRIVFPVNVNIFILMLYAVYLFVCLSVSHAEYCVKMVDCKEV